MTNVLTTPDSGFTFGESIHMARRRARMSQDEIADALGVTRQSVSKWEMDRSRPDIERGLKLLELLDLDPRSVLRLWPYIQSLTVTRELVAA